MENLSLPVLVGTGDILAASFFSVEKKKFVLVNERISQRRRRKEEIPRGRKRPIRYNRPPFVVESSIIDRAKN